MIWECKGLLGQEVCILARDSDLGGLVWIYCVRESVVGQFLFEALGRLTPCSLR